MDPVPSELSPEAAALMAKEVTESLASSSKPTETNKTEPKTEKKGFIARKLEERKVERENRDKPKPGDKSFDRSEFTPDADTGIDVRGRRRSRRFEQTSSRDIVISAEVIKQHGTFLYRHLRNLNSALATNKNLLNGNSHRYERELLKFLKDEKGEISQAKVDKFVETSQGLIIAEMVNDLRTEFDSFAFGLDITVAWGNRMQALPDRDARIINVGDIRREYWGLRAWFRENGGRYPDRRAALAGAIEGGVIGAGASALITSLIQNYGEGFLDALGHLTEVQVAGLVGGAGGAILGGVLGRRFLTNNGDLDFVACAQNLKAIKSLPDNEKAYIRSVTGVDFDDYNVTDGHVTFARAPSERRVKDIFTIKDDIRSRLQTRQDFYKAIGLVRPDTRAVPFNPIRPNYEYFPQTDTLWKRRTNELYREGLASAGISPVDALGVRTAEGLRIHMEAQQKVLDELLDTYVYSHGMEKNRKTGEILSQVDFTTNLDSTISRIETNEEAQKKKLESRISSLGDIKAEGDNVVFDGQSGRLDDISRSFSSVISKQRELIKFELDVIAEHSDVVDPSGIFNIEELQVKLGAALSNMEGERQRIIDDAETKYNAINPDDRSPDKSMQVIFEARDRQITALEDKIQKIRDAQKAATIKITERDKIKQEISDIESKIIKTQVYTLREDYDNFLILGITREQLANSSVGELQNLIRVPDGERIQKSHLDKLLNAMVEARARIIMENIRYSSSEIIDSLGISAPSMEEQLKKFRSMSVDEINRSMNILYTTSSGAEGWSNLENENRTPMIERAQQIGISENTAREEALRLTIEKIQREVQSLKDTQENISSGVLKKQGQLVKNASSVDNVYPKVISVFRDADQRQRFFDVSAVPGDSMDYPTEEERKLVSGGTVQKPRAYFEFLDLIFEYKNKEERGAQFKAASGLVKPIELAGILNESLGLGIVRVVKDRNFFVNVINEIQNRFNTGQITERQMRSAVTDIIIFARGRLSGLIK